MSGLKKRVSNLLLKNVVYFSGAEFRLLREYYAALISEDKKASKDSGKVHKDSDGNDEKPNSNAFLHKLMVKICEERPDGVWISDPLTIKGFFKVIRESKAYFEKRA